MNAQLPLWERPVLRSAAGETLRPGGFALTDRAAEAIGVAPGWRVLDVGSGLGATAKRLRARFGATVLGVEPSMSQLERSDSAHCIVRASGEVLPFRRRVFQAVFCECVFSLFNDREEGLREFHRVLEPGGFLVLSDLCSSEPMDEAGQSCASRALSLKWTHEMVEAGGFSVVRLEDHTASLRDLAARLIWSEGSDCELCNGQNNDRKFGYFLMIAKKQGATHAW